MDGIFLDSCMISFKIHFCSNLGMIIAVDWVQIMDQSVKLRSISF